MNTLLVAAGILVEEQRVLITQRKRGTHLALSWEFPGGKVEPGEDPRAALVRELREELGIDVHVGDIVECTFHTYVEAKKSVLLLFFDVDRVPESPPPTPIDVAALRWARAEELDSAEFPPADADVLQKVKARLSAMAEGR